MARKPTEIEITARCYQELFKLFLTQHWPIYNVSIIVALNVMKYTGFFFFFKFKFRRLIVFRMRVLLPRKLPTVLYVLADVSPSASCITIRPESNTERPVHPQKKRSVDGIFIFSF